MLGVGRRPSTNTDPYWTSVVLLALNEDGPDDGTTFIDASNSAHVLTAAGNAQWDTAQAPTGLTSTASFDGVNDKISTPDSAAFDLTTGDFVIELFTRPSSLSGVRTYVGKYQDNAVGDSSWIFYTNGANIAFTIEDSAGTLTTPISVAHGMSVDTWYHVAVSRGGGNLQVYVAGTRLQQVANTTNIKSGDKVLSIGTTSDDALDYAGWIGSMRITVGTDRGYTGATITVPTLPLPTS